MRLMHSSTERTSPTVGLPTTAAAAASSAQAPQRRRTRRANYADYDAIRQAEAQRASTENANDSSPKGTGEAPVFPASMDWAATSSPYTRRGSPGNTFATRLARSRLLRQLSLYRTGYGVGTLLSRLAEVRAYAAYLNGSVTFFVRPSTLPALPESSASTRQSVVEAADLDAGEAVDRDARQYLEHVIEGGAYAQAALLPQVPPPSPASALDSPPGGVPRSFYRGFLHRRVLDGIYVGHSPIHSRGLFTSQDLPRGTCIVREGRRAFLAAPSFLKLLADTHQQLPDTLHYTHPTGSLMELVLQPLPHHLFNHSCEANVCCGLSPLFWEAAEASGSAAVRERLATWKGFSDPNSFFVTRDVKAGEELTLDYGLRVAPMFAGENAVRERSIILCRCGQPRCRHFVYQQPAEVLAVLKQRRAAGDVSCFDTAAQLLGAGLDDETVLLSHLPSRRPTVAYLYADPIPELCRRNSSNSAVSDGSTWPQVSQSIVWEPHRARKADLLSCYRHVFKLLNEAAPQTPP